MENDPYEQHNLAKEQAYSEVLDSMKNVLSGYLSGFDHPFDLEVDPFMYSDEYQLLVEKSRAVGLDYIFWLKRDHGKLVYPPQKDE